MATRKTKGGRGRAASASSRAAAVHAEKRRSLAASKTAQKHLARFRTICLALPEATEVEAWGHPTFRVRDKIFASFGEGEGRGSYGVKTTLELQAALVDSDPRFTVARYVGKHGWISVAMTGKIDWAEVEELVRGSYRMIAPKRLARQLDE